MNKEPCGYLIKQINDALEAYINSALRDHDITHSQLRLMLTVLNAPEGKLTFKELERKLQVSQPTVVGIISRLESKGFVETMGDPSDKRIKIVTLTQTGAQKCQMFHDVVDITEEKVFAGFSKKEREQILTSLTKIRKNVTAS